MIDTKKGIILKRIYNICVFSSFLVFTILSFAIINPIKNSNAAPQVIDNTVGAYSMSMTASSEADAHAVAGYEQDTHTELDSIVVSNTCPDGSSVMISSNSETGALVGDNGIEISATEPGGELSDNSWGFSTDGGSVWNAVPTADEDPIILYSKRSDQTEPIMIPVLYGFKIDRNAVRDGIYTADVLYTMAPDAGCFIYKISWEGSGGEIPEGFPEYLDQDDRIDLSALPRPTRPHYDFAGWQINDIVYTGNETAVDINPNNSASITVKTLWTPTNYTISYNLNGGVVETENPTSYNIESETITLNNPTREHYTFRGWSGTGLTGDANKNVVIPTGSFDNRSYTANWDVIPYNISYSLSGGTTTNPTTYNIETSTINLSYPEKFAYTFTGWSGTGLSGNGNLNVSIPTGSYGNRSYTAHWTPTNYSISYTLSGGSASNPTSYNVETNSFTLNNPTRANYDFVGWSGTGLSGSNNKSVTISKGSSGNRSYTANFSPTPYAISYALNGGSATNPTSYTVESNNFTLNNPSKSYYDFSGWGGTDLSGTGNKSVTITKGSTGARSYTAYWTPTNYSISYTLNGGSASGNPTSYNIESNAFTLNNPARTYYTFKGWSGTGLSGSANTSVTVPKGSAGDRSYTANWTPVNYSITYNYAGGSATNPATYNIETNTFSLNNPTRASYTFTGWSGTGLSGSANTSVSIAKGSVGNRSYTANWKLATYAATVSTYGASRSCERACDCPHGSLNGPGHCAYDESVGISVSWRESCGPYTCNSGDSLSGSTCYHYSCPSGGRLSGTTCYL